MTNQAATIEEVKNLPAHAGGGRQITAYFHSTGERVTVHTVMRNTAEALMAGTLPSLANDEQRKFFVNAVN